MQSDGPGGVSARSWRDPSPWAAAAVTGAVYAVLAAGISWLSSLATEGTPGASFWPAAGVSVAALLLLPRRVWPAVLGTVLLVETALDLWHGNGLGVAVGWAAGNVVEPLGAVLLLGRGSRRLPDLARREDLLRFVACAVVAGPVLGAGVATVTAALAGGGDQAALPLAWLRWAVGDGVGVLAVAPALLSLLPTARTGSSFPVRPLVAVTGLTVLLLAVTTVLDRRGTPVPSLVVLLVPALAWLALRGGQRASSTGVLVVAAFVEAATAAGVGPFARVGLADAQVFLAAGALTGSLVAVAMHDLVRRDRLAARLRTEAATDALTGVGNRRQLLEWSEALRAEGRGATGCVVVDLDGFKQVNDRYGHAAGDEVLVEVARRLREATRGEDLVVRTGGDEFVICLTRPCSEADLVHLSQRVSSAVAAPVVVAGRHLSVRASVGTGYASGDTDTPDALVRRADQSMYAAKGVPTEGATAPQLPG